MIYYRHFRLRDQRNKLLPHGGFTFAAKRVGNDYHLGFAICSKKDQYSKAVGRDLATKHLQDHYKVVTEAQLRAFVKKRIPTIIDTDVIRFDAAYDFANLLSTDDITVETVWLTYLDSINVNLTF